MTVAFRGLGPGTQVGPGSRLRTVWELNTAGEVSAALNPFRDATDELGRSAQAIIDGVTAQGIGYILNVPPAIAPGDLGVVLDLKTVNSGNGMPAAALADSLQDMVLKLTLVSLGTIPQGESAADALKARQETTAQANKDAKENLPSGILAGAADSVGAGAKQLITFIKWAGVLLIVIGVFYVWRTYIAEK